ncbi:DUF4097 family beta strand repeat-containing protein [Roseivirga echinicomitans]|uniref:DUF4097 domain-containing protein n=1 Tax=Roseivirga echinicomitans TaxID=296218 RepID=A0A150XDB5_9BACT|nr:DUF4097 family beta strand repeat-containing protein [Roseivirga echinicomitans]KYG76664.1 hypothetical protein AWN68_06455 [Roseivirga echinicomitans]
MKKMITSVGIGLVCLIAAPNANAQKDGEFHLDNTYSIGASGTLYLNSEDAEVRITGSSRSDAHIKIDRTQQIKGFTSGRAEFNVIVENRGDDLHVTERERSGVRIQMGSIRTDYRIDIELPESASIRVKGEDDDYVVRNVNGKIYMETEDGDIEIIDCRSNDFEFRLEDGDLRIDGGTGSLKVESEDGDVEVRGGSFNDIDIDIEDGDVMLETSLSDDGRYIIRGEDSSIEFVVTNGGGEFSILKDDGSVRASSAFETVHETDHRSELKLEGGKANVEIRTEDGRVRLSKN